MYSTRLQLLTSEAVIVGVRPAREADLGPGEAVTVIMPLVIVPPHTVRGTVWTVEVFVAGKFKGEGYTGVATVTYVLCLWWVGEEKENLRAGLPHSVQGSGISN